MTKNKNKKPQPPPNQERTSDRAEGSGRGGRGRGRGGRGGRGGGVNDEGGDDPSRRRGGFRGGGPSGLGARDVPSPSISDRGFGRGRGRGRGRGGWIGRGRGFGGVNMGGFTGNFHGGRPVYHPMDEVDFDIQQWDGHPQSGQNTPGGRGRGSPSIPRGNDTFRGRGGRGGRGGFAQKLPPTSSLSSLWHEERPLLRPIKFVRSVETATLFQEAEELLEPTAQNPSTTAESHAPTADKVSRVFSNTHPHLFDNSLFEVEEGIEEVNFEDLALVHERVLNPAPVILTAPPVQGEVFTGIIGNPAPEPQVQPEETSDVTLVTAETTVRTGTEPSTAADVELPDEPAIKASTKVSQPATPVREEPMVVETHISITTAESRPVMIPTEPPPLFVIDTNPSASQKRISVPAYDVHPHTASLGENTNPRVEVESDPEDDVIVYEAPNPRISTPRVELATLTNITFPNHTPSSTPRQINPLRKGKFVHAVGKNAKRGSGGILGVKRKRLAEHGNFAAFGAMIAEARLRSQDDGEDRDPKEHLRRQGDSDVDWGDETDECKGNPTVATAEGMDLDPDLVGSGVTMTAMTKFVEGIDANHVRMDNLEDANAGERSSSDEGTYEDEDGTSDEDVESDEEMMLIEEFLAARDGSDFSDEDEDDELDPRAGFQARLDRLRRKQQKAIEMEDGEGEDEMDQDFNWGDIDNLAEGALGKYGKNRAARNAGSRAIQDGFSEGLQPKASSSKRKDLPTGLQEQWEKDRLKKANKKRERELARLEAALDPLVPKEGGKKSKKAMITAARLDPSIEIRHRIVDMVSVGQQIRRFLADNGKKDMALPACDKSTRKKIHNLAALFGLNSKSKDCALGRYTTLRKTKRTGGNIDERQVTRMMEGFKYRASYDVSDDDWDDLRKGKGKGKAKAKGKGKGKGKGKLEEKDKPAHLKTKEGDVVGHAAPKINETNVGFMMLASMGWSDGAPIGLSGGLEGPITAVIKKTKLGLGAGVSTKS